MGNTQSKLPIPVETSRIVSGAPSQSASTGESAEAQSLSPHSCDNLDCALVKVLETPEVLEHVLTFISTGQILSARLVNKTWNSLITASPQLRLHFFVVPRWRQPASEFQLLPLAIPGLKIKRGEAVHLGHWIEVRMNLSAALEIKSTCKDSPPRNRIVRSLWYANDFECENLKSSRASSTSSLLPRYADLLITQPPTKGMQAFLVDINDSALDKEESTQHHGRSSSPVPSGHSKISYDAGITLGFMADIAEELLTKQITNNEVKYHEDKVVVFKAIVSYCVQSDAAPRMRSTTRTVTSIE